MDPVTISLIVAGAGKLAGAIGSSVENKKQRKILAQQEKSLQDFFDKEYYTPYTQTAEGAASLSAMREQMKKEGERAEGLKAVTGGTQEAELAQKESMLDKYGKTLTEMSGMDTYRKQGLRKDYENRLAQIRAGQIEQATGKSQQWSNLMENSGLMLDAAGYEKLMGAPTEGSGVSSEVGGIASSIGKTFTPTEKMGIAAGGVDKSSLDDIKSIWGN